MHYAALIALGGRGINAVAILRAAVDKPSGPLGRRSNVEMLLTRHYYPPPALCPLLPMIYRARLVPSGQTNEGLSGWWGIDAPMEAGDFLQFPDDYGKPA